MVTSSQYLTVSALTKYLHAKFTRDPYLQKVYLTGEISNFRKRPRHQYFSLKDDGAKIDVVMFEYSFNRLKFQPENGMKVLVTGRVDLYEANGNYQIIIDEMQPDGIGALYQAYEQLKAKLAAEGLFSRPKRPLVKFPRRIAVITSESGAVIKDIITTTRRRYPLVQLVLFPAVVQGDAAADSLIGRLKEVNARGNFDTIIIGRGGGSIEDLWPFNEEKVARAIVASQIPVISSVGHETDTTIADLVADQRAATPTAAAELATPVLQEELVKLKTQANRLTQAFSQLIRYRQQELAKLMNSYIFKQPQRLYENYAQKLDLLESRQTQALAVIIQQNKQLTANLTQRLLQQTPAQRLALEKQALARQKERLIQAVTHYLHDYETHLLRSIQSLEMLSPLKVMGRGFSYVTVADQVIKQSKDLHVNDQVTLHLVDGEATAKILSVTKDEK
ncbi:exodeoxyribonuclease VII large subunit [Ligilactobacillus agilis]|uniref:exodeoxyribonuclease VII large subunit n=1 Tax=Ligilactobacillus agilis TaxID=1601 RepID=UPI00242A6D0F|nr:exodeoxyribonuclease VII large subunit [Ligilactobacillus agilis]